MTLLVNTLIVLATMAGMEAFALYAHKYIMHGVGTAPIMSRYAGRCQRPLDLGAGLCQRDAIA